MTAANPPEPGGASPDGVAPTDPAPDPAPDPDFGDTLEARRDVVPFPEAVRTRHLAADLRRPGRTDRGHATHSGGREALDRPEAVPARTLSEPCSEPTGFPGRLNRAGGHRRSFTKGLDHETSAGGLAMPHLCA